MSSRRINSHDNNSLRSIRSPNFLMHLPIYWDMIPSMSHKIDKKDLQILQQLQKDSSISVEQLAERVNLSRNACWRRMKVLEENGVITKRVAIIDPDALGLGLMVYVLISNSEHDPVWVKKLRAVVMNTPEIVSAHRMSGELDYVLRVRVATVQDYDHFYQQLIQQIKLSSISASFVMENIKETTELPLLSR